MCWERACLEKDKGGLGVRDIKTFNKALLGKWKWLMFSQKEALWVKIVDSRYNGWKGLVEGTMSNKQSVVETTSEDVRRERTRKMVQ